MDLTNYSGEELTSAIKTVVGQSVQNVLFLDEDEVEFDVELAELGFDSITAAKLNAKLRDEIGDAYQIETTDIFDCKNLDSLIQKIISEIPQ